MQRAGHMEVRGGQVGPASSASACGSASALRPGRQAGARSACSVLMMDSTCATCQGEIQTCRHVADRIRQLHCWLCYSWEGKAKPGLRFMLSACPKLTSSGMFLGPRVHEQAAHHDANGSQ